MIKTYDSDKDTVSLEQILVLRKMQSSPAVKHSKYVLLLPCSTGAFIPKSLLPVGKGNSQQGNSGKQNKATREAKECTILKQLQWKEVCKNLHTKHVLDACDLERMSKSKPSTVCSTGDPSPSPKLETHRPHNFNFSLGTLVLKSKEKFC